jgi:autotransporter family porin
MGDAGTQTGTVSIDAASTLFAGDPSVLPFTGGQLVTVINAGVIDLTNGPSATATGSRSPVTTSVQTVGCYFRRF